MFLSNYQMIYYSPYVNEKGERYNFPSSYLNLIYDYERKLNKEKLNKKKLKENYNNYISNFKSNNNSKFFKYL